jgi:hypothetical protein
MLPVTAAAGGGIVNRATRAMASQVSIDIAVALVGAAIFGYIAASIDVIEVRGGLGFDGLKYAQMMDSAAAGTAATRLRPLIVWLNAPMYLMTRSALFSFAFMNHVYAGLLWYCVCVLYRRFDPRPIGRLLIVVSLSLCVATSSMFAYYPVLIDLGAYAVIAWAFVCVLRGPGGVTAVAVAAAMLSREFGVCVLLFGIHRFLRLRIPRRQIVMTFAPAILAFAAIWLWSKALPQGTAGPLFSSANIVRNAALWNDPIFVAFFLYFLVTVFGGIGVVLATSGDKILDTAIDEPEWVTFVLPILIAAALGEADIWRYLAFTLPAAVVVYARCASEWSLKRLLLVSAFALTMTLVLEEPFRQMTVPEYFQRWFPYYVAAGKIPVAQRLPLWSVWGRRFVAVGIGLLVMPFLTRSASTLARPVNDPA